jgi:hypothetical protein
MIADDNTPPQKNIEKKQLYGCGLGTSKPITRLTIRTHTTAQNGRNHPTNKPRTTGISPSANNITSVKEREI